MELPDLTDRVADAIYSTYQNDEPRAYLGASVLGNPCKRALWYGFRWAIEPAFEPRILRLFDSGKREEARLIDELRAAGMDVYDRNEDGEQIGFLEGHLGGSCDGMVQGVPSAEKAWHVLECKTHNEKSFVALKKDGVKKSKPIHFAQMQMYMGKLDVDRALYLAVNKNTDEIYSERVHFDKGEFERLCKVADFVINAEIPPDRISEDPAWFECKFCPFADVCHGDKLPVVSCRSCSFATPKPDGTWHCEQWKDSIPSVEAQRVGCDSHLYIPQLVSFAEPVDASTEWVVYRHKLNDQHFVNGKGFTTSDDQDLVPMFSSAELRIAGAGGVSDGMLCALKTELDATVEDITVIGPPAPMPTEAERYSDPQKLATKEEEGRLLWHEMSETLWREKDPTGYKEAMESGECDDVTGVQSWERRYSEQQRTSESGQVAA